MSTPFLRQHQRLLTLLICLLPIASGLERGEEDDADTCANNHNHDKGERQWSLAQWVDAMPQAHAKHLHVSSQRTVHENGVFTSQRVDTDDDIVRIPINACLTASSVASKVNGPVRFVLEGRAGKHAANALMESVDAALAMHLLHAANLKKTSNVGEDGNIAKWLGMTPTSIRTVMSLTPKELKALQGSNVLAFREQVSATWREVYESVVVPLTNAAPSTFPPKRFERARFLWAMRAVWSRAIDVDVRDASRDQPSTLRALCPLVDMINHDASRPVDAFVKNGVLHLRNRGAPITAGTEVLVSYGNRSSTATALVYGFIEHDNLHDAVDVLLEASEGAAGTPLARRRESLLRRAGVLSSASDGEDANQGNLETPRFLANSLDPHLVLTARLRVATEEELDDAEQIARTSKRGARALLGPPVWRAGQSNDARARITLLDAADALLRRYPGTVNDDDAAMSAALASESPGKVLAIALRMSEKRVLLASLDHVRAEFSEEGAEDACDARFGDDLARMRCRKLSKAGATWAGPEAPRFDVKFRKDEDGKAARPGEGVRVRVVS